MKNEFIGKTQKEQEVLLGMALITIHEFMAYKKEDLYENNYDELYAFEKLCNKLSGMDNLMYWIED